ncbi:ArsR/SmtB family transcription factor [Saccharopolyspora pogona]|uniref:ArsR/SmtB family transcription factor n=1 Tax=Saccharopolyspora pogona TaxID=333966 RepID=UPI001CC2697E|nr:helix-turn-helix transcriptional regulator [Saccharopolyspora pogona]
MLTELGYPVRLSIVRVLAHGGKRSCGALPSPVSKSTTIHWRVLRESGVIYQRPADREIFLTLRCGGLDAKFPGLLKAVLDAEPED